jgi:hypothetical protein
MRRDKKWSLTDCASFELCGSAALRRRSNDHHFEQNGFVASSRRVIEDTYVLETVYV